MPIEIRQLVIRAVVEPTPTAPADRPAPAAPRIEAARAPRPARVDEALVAACVREVMRRLERSQRR